MSAKSWGFVASAWAVVTVGYWIVAGPSVIAWSMVVIALIALFMWWMRVQQERK